MIKIKKRGYKTDICCKHCGCEFSFEKEDILVKSDKLFEPSGDYVKCPQCDETIWIGRYSEEDQRKESKIVIYNNPNGDTRTYRIKVVRGKLEEGEHSTKLVSLKINKNKFALNPEFISIKNNYTLQVPYSTIVLDVEAIPYDFEIIAPLAPHHIIVGVPAKQGVHTLRGLQYLRSVPV